MRKPVVLYYSKLQYQPQNLKRLRREFELIELPNPSYDNDNILGRTEVLFAPLGYYVDKIKIDRCPNLKIIASNTTGHPHIDVEYAWSKGIEVACLKYAQEFLQTITPTAELTMGLIITLTRNIIPAHLNVLKGVWNRRAFGAQAMLSSMALGIVGLGRLGTMVARYAKAFGMQMRYYDPYVADALNGVARCKSLKELVANSDVVTIHVPHEKDTEGMFNAEIFKCFRKGAYLINTSRGELLDWNALLQALQSGHLAGAALDVFEGEFEPKFSEVFPSHPLLKYARSNDNLILTPHIGGSTHDAWLQTESYTIDMVIGFLDGG